MRYYFRDWYELGNENPKQTHPLRALLAAGKLPRAGKTRKG